MCELLVKAVDAIHPDPVIDRQGCYKAGDVVVIKEDGHVWGAGELDTNVFKVIKLPNIPIEDILYLLNNEEYPLPNTAAMRIPSLRQEIASKPRKIITRRRYSIDVVTQQILDKVRG